MTKKEHIEYWLISAENDWEVAQKLFNSRDYLYALFFVHLSLEKTAKALWVKNNELNIPPKIHNLIKILHDTNFSIEDEDLTVIMQINDFNIEGRYPDYKNKLNNICNAEFTSNLMNNGNRIKKCLLEKMQ